MYGNGETQWQTQNSNVLRNDMPKARLQDLRNRENTRQRKMDTRRKVILGGALLDLAERDTGAAGMLYRLVRNLPCAQDQKAFVDWNAPETGGSESTS